MLLFDNPRKFSREQIQLIVDVFYNFPWVLPIDARGSGMERKRKPDRTKPGLEPADKRTFKYVKKMRRRRCKYCGGPEGNTIDHVIPLSRGGRNHWTNMVPCCQRCNCEKSNKTPSEWKHRWYRKNDKNG